MNATLQAETSIAVSAGYPAPEKDEFTFFAHIAPILVALEANDTLLVAELLTRRASVFEKFSSIVKYIVKSKVVEIFFSELYGTFYTSEGDYGKLRFLSETFEKEIALQPKNETITDAFIRYFKEKSGSLHFSLPLVGMNFGNWDAKPRVLHKLMNNLQPENLEQQAKAIRQAQHDFYASLEVVAQIEPYNQADKNAIVIMIDDVAAKMSGCGGKAKAGYLRRTGAEIIRLARPELLSFQAEILRIYSDSDVVIALHM